MVRRLHCVGGACAARAWSARALLSPATPATPTHPPTHRASYSCRQEYFLRAAAVYIDVDEEGSGGGGKGVLAAGAGKAAYEDAGGWAGGRGMACRRDAGCSGSAGGLQAGACWLLGGWTGLTRAMPPLPLPPC